MSDTKFFFHGTDAKLNIGDEIVPGVQVGKDYGRSNHVYLINSAKIKSPHPKQAAIKAAYQWGSVSASIAGTNTVYVYQVEPTGTIEPDNCSDPVGKECVRTALPVKIVDVYVL